MSPQAPAVNRGTEGRLHDRTGRGLDRRMLIDGLLAGAEDAQRLPSVDPATGQILGYAPDSPFATPSARSRRLGALSTQRSGRPTLHSASGV